MTLEGPSGFLVSVFLGVVTIVEFIKKSIASGLEGCASGDEGGTAVLTISRRCRLVRFPGRQRFPHGDSWRILEMTRVVLSTISSFPVHSRR